MNQEFPDFVHLNEVPDEGCPRTCAHVFDAFLAHCESRAAKDDMATVTLTSYRKILNGIWRPRIGTIRFLNIRYSTLIDLAIAITRKSATRLIVSRARAF
jgi:hypothetical protein